METALQASPGTRSPLDEFANSRHPAESTEVLVDISDTPEETTGMPSQEMLLFSVDQTPNLGSSNTPAEDLGSLALPTEEDETNEQQVEQELMGGIEEDDAGEDQDNGDGDSRQENTDEADDNMEYMPYGACVLERLGSLA